MNILRTSALPTTKKLLYFIITFGIF
jgi:hypothetical protein